MSKDLEQKPSDQQLSLPVSFLKILILFKGCSCGSISSSSTEFHMRCSLPRSPVRATFHLSPCGFTVVAGSTRHRALGGRQTHQAALKCPPSDHSEAAIHESCPPSREAGICRSSRREVKGQGGTPMAESLRQHLLYMAEQQPREFWGNIILCCIVNLDHAKPRAPSDVSAH